MPSLAALWPGVEAGGGWVTKRVLTPNIWVKGGRWSMMKEIERWPSCKPVDRLAPSI